MGHGAGSDSYVAEATLQSGPCWQLADCWVDSGPPRKNLLQRGRNTRKTPLPQGTGLLAEKNSAGDQRVILPALRQEVQTLRRLGVPLTIARTRWMLGLKRRLVRRCECDTL